LRSLNISISILKSAYTLIKRGNTVLQYNRYTAPVVTEALFDYYEAGVTTLLIRGFDFVEDAIASSIAMQPAIFSGSFLEVLKPFDQKELS
jgi:pyruvate/oxaloacetate carboxyltransferase